MKYLAKITIACAVFLSSLYDNSEAQEDENRLARPEWQLRADLEFQLVCQKAKDELCREIIRSIDTEAEPGSQPLRLKEIDALLDLSSDQVPASLPVHQASLNYVENRKAAVIAWLKTYKAKGRDLSKTVLDRERAFAAQQSERLKGVSEKTVSDPKKPTSPASVDSSGLKSKIIEVGNLFRASEKEFESAKTTADKHDALNKHAQIFREWGATHREQALEFEVGVDDVVTKQGKYFASTQPPALLESFTNGQKPLVSNKLVFELSDEQRKALNVGDKLLVKCMIYVGSVVDRTNENRRLFSVQVTEQFLQGTGSFHPNIIEPFRLVFMMDAIEISVVEIKRAKQPNPSKPPIRKK